MRVGDGRRGSGVQNAGALPCPRAFRPSGRVRYDLSSPVAASPPGSRGCVRRLGEARRPAAASAWCWICGVAPLDAFVEGELLGASGAGNRGASLGAGSAGSLHSVRSRGRAFSARAVFDSVPGTGRFTRRAGSAGAPLGAFVRAGLLGARGVRLAGNGALHSAPGLQSLHSAAFMRGGLLGASRCSTRCRERGASLGAGSAVAPLGGVHAGGLLGAPGVRLGAGKRGRFTRCRVCGRSARCVR